MRHPTQAALVPPAQAEALYDIALEEESNTDRQQEFLHQADLTQSVAGIISQSLSTIEPSSEGATTVQVPRTVLSENLALPTNVRQTNHLKR
jgi:hypothetical protein